MSLTDVYQKFLGNPKSAPLAADLSLIYVTTITKYEKSDAVVSHLSKQEGNVLKTKAQDVIGVVEGPDSLCLDVETTLEFLSGGGAYLPQIDDNFLADRVATFPTIHIVRFNAQRQIQQIRIYWDQAALLKQVEVIGFRARGWPIRDSKDQTRVIKSAISEQPADAPPLPSNEKPTEEPAKGASPGKRHIKDPYASESLFHLLSPGNDRLDPVYAPRAPSSAKPPPRDLNELFVSHEDVDVPDATPSKKSAVAPKVGAGKNFQRSRLFDDDETVAAEKSEQIAYRANPNRFRHFELGADNSEREIKQNRGRPMSRHTAQWGFEDFATPEKPKPQSRGQERHFGWGDEEQDLQTPPARPHVPKARPDAQTQIELTDEEEDGDGKRIISSFQNKGLSLYKNHLFADEGESAQVTHATTRKGPLSSVPTNGMNRKNDFESHWSASDHSPADGKNDHENKPIGTDRLKAVKMMEPSWDTYDVSPQPKKLPDPPQRQAMRNHNQRSWDFGE